MRCGDHDSRVSAHRCRDKSDTRGRQRPDQQHIHAHGTDSCRQGIFYHVARQTGIFANHDPAAAVVMFKDIGSGTTKLHRHFCRHGMFVGDTSHPVGTKKFLGHYFLFTP